MNGSRHTGSLSRLDEPPAPSCPITMRRTFLLLGAFTALALAPPCLASDAAADGLAVAAPGRAAAQDADLLARFAPLVLLAPGERAFPANVDWYLARSRLEQSPPELQVTQASLLGVAAAWSSKPRRAVRLRPSLDARAGSRQPRDWTVYGHVYRGQGGDTLVQYWFFYPFNDFHWAFDHEGDWEHVTVRLDGRLRPVGAWYARHDWSAPGRWFSWQALAREGDHPVVLSARGSHASYADGSDVRLWDRACATRDPAAAPGAGCVVWRTWSEASGGVVDAGSAAHPSAAARFLAWPGLWGAKSWFGRDSGGPPGPAYQAGWCAQGAPGCS
jgi:hypothetical protein